MTETAELRRRVFHVADVHDPATADDLRRHLHAGRIGVVDGATVMLRRGKIVRVQGPFHPLDLKRGEYGKQIVFYRGRTLPAWWVRTPAGGLGRLSMPEDVELGIVPVCHHVQEHTDGSISVIPQPGNGNSILIGGWHGHIRLGVWERI